jgi:LacI family transcriptional regulator
MARRKDPATTAPVKSSRIGTGRNRQPTINDIARMSAVSKKTVSRVINDSPLVQEETRARVVEVMRKFAYVPDPQARGLAFSRSFLIGLVYDNPNAEFIVNMQLGALDALRGSGYELIVHPCDRRSTGFVEGVRQFVGRQKLRGVILLPPLSEDVQLIEALHSAGCPSVSLASVDIPQATHRVVSSDRDACAALAAHLVALGHRRIGLVRGPEGHRSAHERRIGFLEALRSRGVHIDDTLVVSGGYTFESGIEAGELLLSRSDRPTAIFASNDEMAAGIYQAAYHLGLRIPDDVSVVGFDDGQIASRLWPPLTTIRLPIRVMARIAAAKLIQNASAAEPVTDETVYVIPHLVERASARPPRTTTPSREAPP